MGGVAFSTDRAVDLALRDLDRTAGYHPGSPLHAAKKKPPVRRGRLLLGLTPHNQVSDAQLGFSPKVPAARHKADGVSA
jgi:hypothetical protein